MERNNNPEEVREGEGRKVIKSSSVSFTASSCLVGSLPAEIAFVNDDLLGGTDGGLLVGT